VTALSCSVLVVCLSCVLGSGSNEVAGSRYPGVIHVMFTLFCRVFGRFGKNGLLKDLILCDGGLANCVCHQDVLMVSSCLGYDLNPDLGRNT
jgi:hypothetical protein